MFDFDPKENFERLVTLGQSINGYTLLPDDSSFDLLSTLLRSYENSETETWTGLTTYRLVLFFLLRRIRFGGYSPTEQEWKTIKGLITEIKNKLSK